MDKRITALITMAEGLAKADPAERVVLASDLGVATAVLLLDCLVRSADALEESARLAKVQAILLEKILDRITT